MAPDHCRLTEISLRETVELVELQLPQAQAASLMECGVLPGCSICPLRHSPSGDPVVMVDGVVLALRREVARGLRVKSVAGVGSAA
jgi:Fe2+ transport system protein FeoA